MARLTDDERISRANRYRYATVEPVKLAEFRALYSEKFDRMTMQDKPLISVYTPTFNRCDLLMERAVKSVLCQTYENLEYIIIGDCCTDDTEKLVRSINDPRVRFYNIPKRGYRYPSIGINHWLAGPVTAANQGLAMVAGDWIARLDDDDIWTEDHLEVLLHHALSNSCEFVSGAVENMNDAGEIYLEGKSCPTFNLKKYLKVTSPFDPQGTTLASTPSAWLYRSYLSFMQYNIDCWRKKHNRVNDTDLLERMYRIGVRMGFLDQKVMLYYPRPNELMGSKAFKDNPEAEEKYKFDL